MNPNECPWPHHVEVLHGVDPDADLPEFCFCGAPITYADEVIFLPELSEPESVPGIMEKISQVEFRNGLPIEALFELYEHVPATGKTTLSFGPEKTTVDAEHEPNWKSLPIWFTSGNKEKR